MKKVYKSYPVPSPTDDNGGGGAPDPNPPKETWWNKHLFQIGLAIIIVITAIIVILGTAK